MFERIRLMGRYGLKNGWKIMDQMDESKILIGQIAGIVLAIGPNIPDQRSDLLA